MFFPQAAADNGAGIVSMKKFHSFFKPAIKETAISVNELYILKIRVVIYEIIESSVSPTGCGKGSV